MIGAADRVTGAAGAGLCASATLLVGSSVAVSGLLADYPVFSGQAWRYLLAGSLLMGVLWLLRLPWVWPTARETCYLCALATTGMAGFNIVLLAALEEADPAFIGCVLGTAPIVMSVAAAVWRRRRPPLRIIAAAMVVSAGVLLIEGAGGATALGVALAIGVLACELGFSLLAVPLLPRLGPLRMSAYACLLTVPILMVFAGLEPGNVLVAPSVRELAALAWLSVVVTAAAFVFWYTGLARLGPERSALFLGLVPVGALATGLVVGLVSPTRWGIIGCLVCACGITIGTAAQRPEDTPATAATP